MGVRLLAAGDICLGDHYFSLGHGTGSHIERGENPFDEIRELLQSGDLRFANLECPLSATSTCGTGPEGVAFRAPPAAVRLLHEAGFNVLNIANNHALQHGAKAYRAMVEAIERQGISPLGILNGTAGVPVVKSIHGLTIGFLGYSLVPEHYLPGQRLYADATIESVLVAVTHLKRKVDLVAVSMHWGKEATALPTRAVSQTAHAIVSAGATLVLGHHPHWFQPIERIGSSLIAYSLGDFVFDLFWHRRLTESAVLQIDLDARGVLDHRLIPTRFGRDYKVRLQSQPQARRFLKKVEKGAHAISSGQFSDHYRPQIHFESVRKMGYFLSRLPFGHVGLKVRFVLDKVTRRARQVVGRGKKRAP